MEGISGRRELQPDEELLWKESVEILEESICDLNANDILFLELYYRKELPPESIAKILNISVNSVYSKKPRITKKIIKIAKKKQMVFA